MSDFIYYLLCGICVIAVLWGINLMSKIKTSVLGNGLSTVAMVAAYAGIERGRLRTGIGILEFERTKEILVEKLPNRQR